MNTFSKTIALAAITCSSSVFAFEALDFSTLDANDDGVISLVEAKEDSELFNQFVKRDTDQNGELSKEEYSKA